MKIPVLVLKTQLVQRVIHIIIPILATQYRLNPVRDGRSLILIFPSDLGRSVDVTGLSLLSTDGDERGVEEPPCVRPSEKVLDEMGTEGKPRTSFAAATTELKGPGEADARKFLLSERLALTADANVVVPVAVRVAAGCVVAGCVVAGCVVAGRVALPLTV